MSRLPAFPELREVNRDRIAFDRRAADRDRGRSSCPRGARGSPGRPDGRVWPSPSQLAGRAIHRDRRLAGDLGPGTPRPNRDLPPRRLDPPIVRTPHAD